MPFVTVGIAALGSGDSRAAHGRPGVSARPPDITVYPGSGLVTEFHDHVGVALA